MHKTFSEPIALFKGILLGLFVAIGASYVSAWTGPAGSPPTGNTSAPINISATSQVKSGGLWVDTLGTTGNAVFGGSIKLAPQTQPFTCTAANEGYLYYNITGKKYYMCNGASWIY